MPSLRSAESFFWIRRAALIVALLCLASTSTRRYSNGNRRLPGDEGVTSQAVTQPSSSSSSSSSRRQLSVASCNVPRAKSSPIPINPTWQASFPGSGSRMTYFLIRALTGIVTRNEEAYYDELKLGSKWPSRVRRGYKDRRKVVAVKTHYPVNNPEGFERVDVGGLFHRAIVIFRNPLHSIPSLFNQYYEQSHNLPTHSVRGPLEDWLAYRDHSFFHQLELFEIFVEYWMEKYQTPNALLLLSYEDLTHDSHGPLMAGRIAEFLGRTRGVTPVDSESIPCVWDTVVNYNHNRNTSIMDGVVDDDRSDGRIGSSKGEVRNPMSLRHGPTVRPFSERMLVKMVEMLERLLAKYGDDQYFRRTFSKYVEIVSSTPVEEGL